MSTCAGPKTTAITKAIDENWDRIFGKRKPSRGRWVQHPTTGELIPAHEYRTPERSKLIVGTDRIHEGNRAPDGSDIGNAKKRRAWMKETGVADASDFSPKFLKERRDSHEQSEDASRVEAVGRALYKHRRP